MANEFVIKNGFYSNGNSAVTGSLIVSASGANNDLRIGTNKLFVSASGNVGIGTTTPTAKLEVNGDFKFGRFGGGTLTFGNYEWGIDFDMSPITSPIGWARANRIKTADPSGSIFFGAHGRGTELIKSFWTIDTPESETFFSTTNGIHLQNNGNVGIGITTPSAKLHVNNTSTSSSFLVEDSANPDSTPFIIDAAGNVGIGTTTPSAKLEVSGSYRFGPTGLGSVYFQNWDYGTDMDISSATGSSWARAHRITTSNVSSSIFFGVFGSATAVTRAYWTVGAPNIGNNLAGHAHNTGIHLSSSGNVGIGIQTPTARLHINHTGSGNSFLVEDETNPDTTPFVIDTTGNVGIGTTTPTAKLDVNGSFRFGPIGPGSVYFRSWDYGTDMDISSVTAGGWARAHRIITSDTGGAVYFGAYGSDTTSERAYWTIGTTGSVEIGHAFTTGVHLLKNGNVGIGTYVPTAKLHITNTSTSASFLVEDSANPDSTPFIIDASGNVGIGTTSPTAKLTVQVTGSAASALVANFIKSPASSNETGSTFIRISSFPILITGSGQYTDIEYNSGYEGPFRYGTYADTNIINGIQSTNGQYGNINFVTSGSTRMTVAGGTSAGNVGIGTTNPLASLHVNNTTTSASLLIEDSANPDTTPFVIDSSGDVGIGTTTPTAKLDIVYASSAGTGVLIRGGGGVLDSTPLKLWDIGTAMNNRNIIEFAHNSTYVTASRIYSTNPSPNATTGGKLVLETTSDNIGTFNTNQLVLSNNGNVGIGILTPTRRFEVVTGSTTAYFDLQNTSGPLAAVVTSDFTKLSRFNASDGTNSISVGLRSSAETANPGFGEQNDTYIYANSNANGLNIINAAGTGTADYIKFFAGKVATETPSMIIIGSGSSKGNVGIGTAIPNATLDVSGSTIISGSLTVTGGITGSITASGVFGPYGSNSVITSSFAVTASYFNATIQTSGSSIYSTNPAAGPNFNTTRGIFIGTGSGLDSVGSDKIAIGTNAGKLNTGTETVAIGERAGESNSTDFQVAIGLNAGRSNSGDSQIAIGLGAGLSNTGDSQTAVGSGAGSSNTGDYQTAIGVQAGNTNTGINQVAIGFNAGLDNSGDNQTAIGQAAGTNNTGSNNVNIGYQAGSYVNIGAPGLNFSSSNSVFLGADTAAGGAARINQIVIGYGTEGIGSNSVIIGNTDIEVTALRGKVGVNTTTPNAQLDVNGDTIITGSFTVTGSYNSPAGNTIDSNALIQAGLLYLSNNF